MAKGAEKAGKILDAFPASFVSRHDVQLLEPIFRQAMSHAEATGSLQLQHELALVQRHVTACYQLWIHIRAGRLAITPSVSRQYRDIIEMQQGQQQPRPISPVKTPSRHGSASSIKDPEVAAIKRAQLLQLSKVWAEHPSAAELPDLTRFGDLQTLRKIKVSCGSLSESYAPSQVFV